jgi:hypothetical protein
MDTRHLRAALRSLTIAVALAVTAAAAQNQPDFSGRWLLVDPAHPGADAPRALTVRQPVVSTTARGTPMLPAFLELTVERQFEQNVRTDRYKLGVEGGVVSGGPGAPHQESHFAVTWRGDHLFITTSVTSGPTPDVRTTNSHTEDWSFDDRGRLLIVVVDREGDAQPLLQTLTYTRSQ